MQAIILAAGMGRRLGEYTSGNTKCMLEVNGVRLIDRMLNQLLGMRLSRIVIVIGYRGENLRSHIVRNYPDAPIEFVENTIYDRTNNIYSLWLAREYMVEEATLLLESDLIFEDAVIEAAIDSEYENCALISKYETWMDGTMVRIDSENNILNFIPKKAFNYAETSEYFKTVNIYKFSVDFVVNHYLPFLEAYIRTVGENEYYEQVLRVLTLIDNEVIKALPVTGLKWYEIDDVQDLRIAEVIFAEPELRLKKLQHSYGGYWRYPYLMDFCYLVNPYYPSQRMIEEMKANYESLLRDYPSGMGINSLLASKYFWIKHDYVVVGNGAAELIKSLMSFLQGRIGVIYPTFEEYPNRLDPDRIIGYYPQSTNFSYTAEDLIDYFSEHSVENLIIVNPDNPSGNFIDKEGLLRLAEWAKERNVRLVIDESFVDFANAGDESSVLTNELLAEYPIMAVMKSISKSYGVPGLRLGILASGDRSLIEFMRKDVGIWNINSFAEFYLQIYGKYENDYAFACRKIKCERNRLFAELQKIPFLKVIPSEANYFLCEVVGGMTSHKLTLRLLAEHNILIKDCSAKKGFENGCRQFVRIAVRDQESNQILLDALERMFYKTMASRTGSNG